MGRLGGLMLGLQRLISLPELFGLLIVEGDKGALRGVW
jgi:hypothetical protein